MDPKHASAYAALDKAKIRLMTKEGSVFFTTLAFSLKHIITDEVPTAATDDLNILYNPDFVLSLSIDELVFLILHETLHVALLHSLRRGSRCPDLWNVAGDYCINDTLVEARFKMPSSGLYDPKYHDMSTTEIYDSLPKNGGQQAPWDDIQGSGHPGDPGNDVPAAGTSQLENQVAEIMVRAAMQAQMLDPKNGIGKLPGEMQIYLDRLLNPKLPWNLILRRFTSGFAKNDYTLQRPNRRYLPKHYLPSLHSPKLTEFAAALDASSSVSDHEFKFIASEIHNAMKRGKPDKVKLITFDTKIRQIDTVKRASDILKIKFHGRGGTDIRDTMQWAVDNKPELLLVFTDGEFRFEGRPVPTCPVVWLIHGKSPFNPPYGKVIRYEPT